MDRSVEAALPGTTLRLVRKSSANDSVRPRWRRGVRVREEEHRLTASLDFSTLWLYSRSPKRSLNLPPAAGRTRYRCLA